jgi:hypothetical protein
MTPLSKALIGSCVTLYRYGFANWVFQPEKPPILGPGAQNNYARPYQSVRGNPLGWTTTALTTAHDALSARWRHGYPRKSR